MSIRRFYSQAGQDRWVVQDVFNYRTGGYFLDVGAFDGVFLSNTFWLEKNLGWKGICIEADPETFALLRRYRTSLCLNACVGPEGVQVDFVAGLGPYSGSTDGKCGEQIKAERQLGMTAVSLGTILRRNKAPATIDYLSLDVEGMEEEVMSTFPFNEYRFLCATIERPSTGLRSMLRNEGYLLVMDQPGMDAFYLHRDLAGSYVGRIMDGATTASFGWPKRITKFLSPFFLEGLRSGLRRL